MFLFIVITIFIIIIIFIIYHLKNYNKIAKDIEILQITKITRDKLENLCRNNQPIVIYQFPSNPILNKNIKMKINLQNTFPAFRNEKDMDYIDYIKKYDILDNFLIESMICNSIINKEFINLLKLYHSPLNYHIENTNHFPTIF